MTSEYFDSDEFQSLLNDFLTKDDDFAQTSTDDYDENSSDSLYVQSQAFNSNSLSDSEFDFQLQKQKRTRKYTYIPKLRVLKRDVRRSYADMFINVWNAAEFPLLFGFLDTYFQSNFQQQSFKPHNKDKGSVHHCRETNGVVSVAKFWYTTMLLAPDMTMRLKDVKVVYSDDTKLNRVEATFHMTGTRVFYVPDNMHSIMRNLPVTDEEKSLYNCDAKVGTKRVNDTTSRLSIVDSIMNTMQTLVKPFPLSPNPIAMDVEGSFSMYTDRDNRVSRMVMSMSPNKGCGSACVQGYNSSVQQGNPSVAVVEEKK